VTLDVHEVATRIDWVAGHCQLLRSISAEFKDTQPFRGLTCRSCVTG
jgi:S-adenosylhomocysteine hydrolase